MTMTSSLLVSFLAFGVAYGSTPVSQAASQYRASAEKSHLSQWEFLNATLGGRLEKGTPVSSPCFSVVGGKNVTVDSNACAAVQKGYTDPTFRASIFGAYMNVSQVVYFRSRSRLLTRCMECVQPQWESCQANSQQCLLDSANVSNPAAWNDFQCSQGSVPPYYVRYLQTFVFAIGTETRVNPLPLDRCKKCIGCTDGLCFLLSDWCTPFDQELWARLQRSFELEEFAIFMGNLYSKFLYLTTWL